MPSTLPVGRLHSYDELALYVQVDGVLTDAFKAEYEVYDETAGYPGTAIAPGATRQDVTATDGHFATGCYGVYDSVAGAAWTPLSAIARGRVCWYFTIEDGGPEYVVERAFEVVETTVSVRPASNLFLVDDLLSHPQLVDDPPDARTAFSLIVAWTNRITRYCRQHFSPIRKEVRLKWRPNAHLFLPLPLFGLTSFQPIDEYDIIRNTELVVWGATGGERWNPKIEMRDARPAFGLSIMTTVRVTGVWGFLEEGTMDAPEDLKEAALKVLAQDLFNKAYGSTGTVAPFGPLRREKTDGHEVEYAVVSTVVRSGMLALLKDPALRDQLDLYRAPIAMAVTGAV